VYLSLISWRRLFIAADRKCSYETQCGGLGLSFDSRRPGHTRIETCDPSGLNSFRGPVRPVRIF